MKAKGNLLPWVVLLALQFILALGLSMFWYYEGELLRDPAPRAAAETAAVQSKKVTDREALGIIVGQQIRIQGLQADRVNVRRYAGYMALLSIAGFAFTFGLMIRTVIQSDRASSTGDL